MLAVRCNGRPHDMPDDQPDEGPLRLSAEEILLIRRSSQRLSEEFEGVFNVETIERFIIDSQTKLSSTARIANWLPVLVERFTRDRLKALARLEVGSLGRPAVLFLCVHNAGRSQIAAGWLRHMAGDRVDVFSGGSQPEHSVNDVAIEAMQEVGIDISHEYPKPWTDEIARAADVIVSMGCGDACPVFPGKRYEDWDLTDPAGQPLEVVRQVRDQIRSRVEDLVKSLGLDDYEARPTG